MKGKQTICVPDSQMILESISFCTFVNCKQIFRKFILWSRRHYYSIEMYTIASEGVGADEWSEKKINNSELKYAKNTCQTMLVMNKK